ESRCAGGTCATAGDYVRRARARSAVHRFADALGDLDAAARARRSRGDGRGRHGPADEVAGDDIAALRATILVATGSADAAIGELEAAVARNPRLASRSALAGAYAAAGRFTDADRVYAAALDALDTTSPFPYASLYFSRGVLWAEQARDLARGAAMYQRALDHVPRFAAA